MDNRAVEDVSFATGGGARGARASPLNIAGGLATFPSPAITATNHFTNNSRRSFSQTTFLDSGRMSIRFVRSQRFGRGNVFELDGTLDARNVYLLLTNSPNKDNL